MSSTGSAAWLSASRLLTCIPARMPLTNRASNDLSIERSCEVRLPSELRYAAVCGPLATWVSITVLASVIRVFEAVGARQRCLRQPVGVHDQLSQAAADTFQEANGLLGADRTPKIPLARVAKATSASRTYIPGGV